MLLQLSCELIDVFNIVRPYYRRKLQKNRRSGWKTIYVGNSRYSWNSKTI